MWPLWADHLDKARQWPVRLREAGYRLTAPRRVVVEVIARS